MNPLISPRELRELRALLPDAAVLDVRWQLGRSDGHRQYLAGHVPGAVYVDLESDLSDPPGRPPDDRGRHPLPDPDRFAAAMRRCGVRRDRTVVVYDDTAGTAATRAWWLLRYHGHPDVRVLDGGWSSWVADDGSAESGEVRVEPGDLTPDPGHLPTVDAEEAGRIAREGVLLDARAAMRFRGEVEPVDRVAGHVPGAVNVPTSANIHDGRWRSAEELAAVYAMTEGGPELAAYCGSGVTATHDLFALHLLGREAALYAGSWSGWVSDPRRPVATGGQP